jgi:hypothetical protein
MGEAMERAFRSKRTNRRSPAICFAPELLDNLTLRRRTASSRASAVKMGGVERLRVGCVEMTALALSC